MVSGRVTFDLLPPEIREHILLLLDPRSLFSASSVSKTWYRAISPVTDVWRRACQSLCLQIQEGIDSMMCRALFLRLVLRLRSIKDSRCFFTRSLIDASTGVITAVYYNEGKLATGSKTGKIRLWICPEFKSVWLSERHSSEVTSIKFDDSILLASYGDGSIASWNCLTGHLEKIYCNPCVYAAGVDFLTDVNLVISTYTSVVGWNMSSGELVLVEDLRGKSASKVVIKPYLDGEDSCSKVRKYNVRKMLIASIVEDHVVVWLATSSEESHWRMNVTITTLTAFRRGYFPRHFSQTAAYRLDNLYCDGKFLYFARRNAIGSIRKGIVCQWDVVEKIIVTEFHFDSDILCLLGVGKKYIMIITTDEGRDQLQIMERQSSTITFSCPIVRYLRQYSGAGNEFFCLGSRSWLDGFDGYNDSGAVCIFVSSPNLVHVVQWSQRNDQRFLPHCYRNYSVNNLFNTERFQRHTI